MIFQVGGGEGYILYIYIYPATVVHRSSLSTALGGARVGKASDRGHPRGAGPVLKLLLSAKHYHVFFSVMFLLAAFKADCKEHNSIIFCLCFNLT